MNQKILQQLIAGGESPTAEFKREMERPDHPASREAVRRLYQNSGELIYDTLVVQETTLADLESAKLERYFWQETGRQLDDLPLPLETVLENLKVLGPKNGDILATVAGLLIFGRDPARWLPQSELILARFEGRELGGDWIDRLEVRDTLPEAIDAALAFVRRNTRLSSRIVGMIDNFNRKHDALLLQRATRANDIP